MAKNNKQQTSKTPGPCDYFLPFFLPPLEDAVTAATAGRASATTTVAGPVVVVVVVVFSTVLVAGVAAIFVSSWTGIKSRVGVSDIRVDNGAWGVQSIHIHGCSRPHEHTGFSLCSLSIDDTQESESEKTKKNNKNPPRV